LFEHDAAHAFFPLTAAFATTLQDLHGAVELHELRKNWSRVLVSARPLFLSAYIDSANRSLGFHACGRRLASAEGTKRYAKRVAKLPHADPG
jgi:hypothetical protein